ncbi:hypothetical protein SARC_09252 [Sphaeroforma arctica JP610]|uniref:Uncharacterized protein n=1 Tax=Sphaeroforma arctica JP610 TaxID=667725 RepID=A0A0L0FP80_9EUKA|nr:hypothetical protein SARC_09252 [Sphaeroforma arctica JP610]KNC78316.1 hypothetical protein SARC_09252 [Sphaeroforma arctica JP610]|eukprot:XP_014152218.1 hypothetical protein SARC_09252 [Sphaeroforma arctica JP610]
MVWEDGGGTAGITVVTIRVVVSGASPVGVLDTVYGLTESDGGSVYPKGAGSGNMSLAQVGGKGDKHEGSTGGTRELRADLLRKKARQAEKDLQEARKALLKPRSRRLKTEKPDPNTDQLTLEEESKEDHEEER